MVPSRGIPDIYAARRVVSAEDHPEATMASTAVPHARDEFALIAPRSPP